MTTKKVRKNREEFQKCQGGEDFSGVHNIYPCPKAFKRKAHKELHEKRHNLTGKYR